MGTTMPSTSADIVEHPTTLGFAETVDRLKRAIEAAGLTLFAMIDHAEAASSVGLSMPPTVVLIYGAPRGGTPLMLAVPSLALDLPLRVLVRQASDGRVIVASHPIADALRRAGLPEHLLDRLNPAQNLLVESLRA